MQTGRRLARFALVVGLALVAVAAGLGPGRPAAAQTFFERLVLPGDLVEAHAKFQPECKKCHVSFSRRDQAPLCRDCHDKVDADIKAKAGFHGRSAEVAANDCRHCHTDHVGRDADIVGLDAATFDHGLTDFALEGAHATVACDSCHEKGKKFREAPGACVDCHKEDEPHMGRLGRECETCHRSTAWTDLRPYDHSKTRFALKDGHQKVACAACHVAETYKDLPLTCIGCHRIQDVHQASVGPKCETCHSPAGWTKVSFDHGKDTKFPLRGKHAKAKCQACHSPEDAKGEPKPDCVGCHKADDPHKGKLGDKCDSCHAEEGWRESVAFDHDITKFPLIGLHVLVPCEACHIDETYRGTPVDCIACHRQDDVHKGTLGPKCETCHNPNDWALWTFDHDTQTKFRLTGQHKGLVCRACHVEGLKDPLKPPTACIGCHRRDDVHKGRFGTNCAACHATDTFKGARLR